MNDALLLCWVSCFVLFIFIVLYVVMLIASMLCQYVLCCCAECYFLKCHYGVLLGWKSLLKVSFWRMLLGWTSLLKVSFLVYVVRLNAIILSVIMLNAVIHIAIIVNVMEPSFQCLAEDISPTSNHSKMFTEQIWRRYRGSKNPFVFSMPKRNLKLQKNILILIFWII